ncbi:YfcC family protein [Gammaproteobacteria bacterium LSUCC0112]|nr:YfcC family protein [Gammaproteobacteria bacterium LSUCC0112]
MKDETAEKLSKQTNPIIVLMGILMLATLLTYLVDSGTYQRDGRLVIPDSYRVIEKERSLSNLFSLHSGIPESENGEQIARPVSVVGTLMSIPTGLERMAGLIFMVLLIGGMFGIMTKSGAIDAGLERLLGTVRGNVYVLVPGLMLLFAAGSTFLGLASEYLLVIPLMVAMANRLGMSNLMGLAIVTIPVKAGYLSSVTNPLPLTIAQPLLGLQIFSGAGLRFVYFLIFTLVGILFMLYMIRRAGFDQTVKISFGTDRLSRRHTSMLLVLLAGIAGIVSFSNEHGWGHHELSSFYIGLAIILAALSGLGASGAADAFVSGMKKILMASMLIGVASAVAVTLENGRVLDSVVHGLTSIIGTDNAYFSAAGMFGSQLMLDFLIPSTSGQAAVAMPILGPLGQLTGVPPQTTVLAFLFGNGITNMLTPTSGTLLAYLAAAQVGWVQWAKFIVWLWAIYIVLALMMLTYAVAIGY